MKTTILDGKACAEAIRNELQSKIKDSGLSPTLSIVYIGDDPASAVYIRNKLEASKKVGIRSILHQFDSISTEEVTEFIKTDLKEESGVIVQLPIPTTLDRERVLDSISPSQDVDGLHPLNIGRRALGDPKAFWPCTPLGCIELLDRYKIDLAGLHAVVIGRSNLVGRPVAALLEMRNSTVTLAPSRSTPLFRFTRDADLIVAATGRPKMITAEMIKEGAIVLDVGINQGPDGKLCGDVDFDNVKNKCSYISPVPGGIGPMTVAELLVNTFNSESRKLRK